MALLSNEQLKKLFTADGLVSPENFDIAVRDSARMGQDVSQVLTSRGLITQNYYYDTLAKFFGVTRANFQATTIDQRVLRLIPGALAQQRHVIAYGRNSAGAIILAMEDPSDLQTIEFLTQYLRTPIVPTLASSEDLSKGFRLYTQQSTADFKLVIESHVQDSLRAVKTSDVDAASELPVVAIVDTLLSYAVISRASDVHLEVLETDTLVRFRIDGLLREIVRVPRAAHAAIVARIKILGSLKLDEHARPQDGRFRYTLSGVTIDARVSILPTLYGETVVLRILPATQRPFSFGEVGMLEDTIAIIEENLKKSYGMVLVTGPTGSGKTTTLYMMIGVLNTPERNIVTVEDPIEFGIPNVNQTQVNIAAGLTFADGLRSIVRQDPNVIMIGEIRDKETAEIAVHSALTGSLVLSTLHTNDAATAVPRLLDIGMQPFLLAAVLNLVIAQRLVRRICVDCIVSYAPDDAILRVIVEQLKAIGVTRAMKIPKLFYRGKGCAACGQTGYRSRMGIYEALQVSSGIQQLLVSSDFTLDKLELLARKEGMVTMFEDGLRKVIRGMTTIEEVLRVIRE